MSSDFGSELISSLPCMDASDWSSTVASLQQLMGSSSSSSSTTTTTSDIEARHAHATVQDAASPPASQEQLVHVYNALVVYQTGLYADKGVTARCNVSFVDDNDKTNNKKFTIRTYAQHVDTANCCTGSWSAVWNLEILNEKEVNLEGSVNLHVQYGEGAGTNVQTRSTRTFMATKVSTEEEVVHAMVAVFEKSKMSYQEQLAKAVVDAIAKREQLLYSDLHGMFDDTTALQLKQLRRILPITKTRFKWDSAAQQQVRLLNDRKTA